ncbi:MAG: two-component sensor histidine kinase [Bacteroidetes bacterium]|nr:two-component sensor histidine kinase [Bacteroidota bacterium]
MNNINSSDVIVFVCAGLLIILLLFGFILFFIISYRHKQKDFNLLQTQKQKIDEQKVALETTLKELKETQDQLIQNEKMASLGELTAGIAHEIQNPLNFVNNFSDINIELADELALAIQKPINERNVQDEESIINIFKENEDKINHHGKRAAAIVKSMLQHSRNNTGTKEPTSINALCDEYSRLSYHGLRAKDKTFNATLETSFDPSIGLININAQDIGRVLLNLLTNAFYATNEKKKTVGENYLPTVKISTKNLENKIEIRVEDNGTGIPETIKNKIFQPFFTTKPTGQGTGLGLSLSFDLIKAQGGQLHLQSKEGMGTTFIIILPS